MPCTSPPWPCILLTLDLPDIDFMVLFWIFLQTGFSKLSGSVNLQRQGTARFWMLYSPIKALTLWMLATYWTRSPSKIKSLRTFNTRSRHAFPIAILVLLLPKSSITGDLNIVRNIKLRDLLSKGPKYREPVSYSWHQNFDIIMDACKEYARRWAKKEDVEVDTLSEWIKSIAEVLKRRIRRLKHSVNTRHESIFSDPDVVRELSRLHENFVIVPADKASNTYTFVCKRHYVSILSEELGLNSLPGNPTYNLTDLSASEVLKGMVNFTLPSTTSEMISISTSQTFRSWVVIFHHRRPMACLSLNLYDTPGLAPRMNVLFWGPADFLVSYSNRDTLWNAWNRHSGIFMVDTGILLSNME